jgi:hypothetical protein
MTFGIERDHPTAAKMMFSDHSSHSVAAMTLSGTCGGSVTAPLVASPSLHVCPTDAADGVAAAWQGSTGCSLVIHDPISPGTPSTPTGGFVTSVRSQEGVTVEGEATQRAPAAVMTLARVDANGTLTPYLELHHDPASGDRRLVALQVLDVTEMGLLQDLSRVTGESPTTLTSRNLSVRSLSVRGDLLRVDDSTSGLVFAGTSFTTREACRTEVAGELIASGGSLRVRQAPLVTGRSEQGAAIELLPPSDVYQGHGFRLRATFADSSGGLLVLSSLGGPAAAADGGSIARFSRRAGEPVATLTGDVRVVGGLRVEDALDVASHLSVGGAFRGPGSTRNVLVTAGAATSFYNPQWTLLATYVPDACHQPCAVTVRATCTGAGVGDTAVLDATTTWKKGGERIVGFGTARVASPGTLVSASIVCEDPSMSRQRPRVWLKVTCNGAAVALDVVCTIPGGALLLASSVPGNAGDDAAAAAPSSSAQELPLRMVYDSTS